jgi:hypothetical protein
MEGHTHKISRWIPPIRGLFSTRGAHDQFPGNEWEYFFFVATTPVVSSDP